MGRIVTDNGAGDSTSVGTLTFFGLPSPPPVTTSAGPTLGSAPTVSSNPTPGQGVATTSSGTLPTSTPATAIQLLTSDPSAPVIGQIWYRQDTSQLCVRHDTGTTKRVTLA